MLGTALSQPGAIALKTRHAFHLGRGAPAPAATDFINPFQELRWHSGCWKKQVMTAVLIILGIVTDGLILEWVAAARAPLGYQDENGFHFGQEHGKTVPELRPETLSVGARPELV